MRRLLPLVLALSLSLPAAAEPARGSWAFSVLVPGLGQAFLGEPGKGLAFALGTYGALSLIPVSGAFYAWLPMVSVGTDIAVGGQFPDFNRVKTLMTIGDILFYSGLVVGLGCWGWAAVDAFIMEREALQGENDLGLAQSRLNQ